MQEAAVKPSVTAQGALATYKDLCALAVALERPQLLYALIDVAAEATPHAARRGSLLGVRSSSVQASRALLEGHAAALLPKLYRGSCAPPGALQRGALTNTLYSVSYTHLTLPTKA